VSADSDRTDSTGHEIPLIDEIHEGLGFQTYPPPPQITGVRHVPLQKTRAEEGWFTELFRTDPGGQVHPLGDEAGWCLRQVSASWAEPGRVNAFHIHPKRGQNEYWTVLRGHLLVWLVDCRRDSPTAGVRHSWILSGEAPGRLTIPAGVAHGYRAGTHGALLVYGMDQQFDATDPDEGRLPWDFFGDDLWRHDTG